MDEHAVLSSQSTDRNHEWHLSLFNRFQQQRQTVHFLYQLLLLGFYFANLVTDVLVTIEFHDKQLHSEFYASIVIFLLSTLFQIFIGLFVEQNEPHNRYVEASVAMNTFLSILISACQLRIPVETYYVYLAWHEQDQLEEMLNSRCNLESPVFCYNENESSRNNKLEMSSVGSNCPDEPQQTPSYSKYQTCSQTRAAVALMKGMFQDIPQLILQTYSIVRFDNYTLLTVASVVLGIFGFSGSMSAYSCKEDSLIVKLYANVYVLGHLGLRVISIVLLSTSQGSYSLIFICGIIVFAITWGAVLGLGRKSDSIVERIVVATIISPMLTIFPVDTSAQDLHTGTAEQSFVNRIMWPFIVWRVLEGIVGIIIATTLPETNTEISISEASIWTAVAFFLILIALGFNLLHCSKIKIVSPLP